MRDIINKFVGMNAETRARTITAFIIAVADALSVFGVISFSDAQLDSHDSVGYKQQQNR